MQPQPTVDFRQCSNPAPVPQDYLHSCAQGRYFSHELLQSPICPVESNGELTGLGMLLQAMSWYGGAHLPRRRVWFAAA